MEGKEAIIAEIIGKAETAAAALIAAAQAEQTAAVEKVTNEERRKQADAVAAAQADAEELVRRSKTLGGLQARKIELAAKQKVIDAAYDEAVKKVCNMTDHIYREYIGELIERYAEDGDCVVIAERDGKRLHAEWLQALCRKTGKHLSFAPDTHGGKGGIILEGKGYDKNLTLETQLAALRERTVTDVAKRLFK